MEITEVRVKLMEEPGERLQAFCSITFDDAFVVRDLKIIEGTSGPFVAMPSRKLTGALPPMRLRRTTCAPPSATSAASALEASSARPEGRRRPRQALCRHRPPHQFDLPGDDPAAGDPGLPGGEGAGEVARLRAELRRFRRRKRLGPRRRGRPIRPSRRRRSRRRRNPAAPTKCPPRSPRTATPAAASAPASSSRHPDTPSPPTTTREPLRRRLRSGHDEFGRHLRRYDRRALAGARSLPCRNWWPPGRSRPARRSLPSTISRRRANLPPQSLRLPWDGPG